MYERYLFIFQLHESDVIVLEHNKATITIDKEYPKLSVLYIIVYNFIRTPASNSAII